MAIIKQYHKDTDTTYVYESTSYWDASKGQSRSKRRCIGKLDPETGEIVPTGQRGRKKKAASQASVQLENQEEYIKLLELYKVAQSQAARLEARETQLRSEIRLLSQENQELRKRLEQIHDISAGSSGDAAAGLARQENSGI